MSKCVAISVCRKNGIDSALDHRFGRAPAFVIIDLDSRKVICEFDNESINQVQGAGTGAAARIAKEGVDGVISGRFGPKAYEALKQLGIEMWVAPDTITAAEAITRLESGELEHMEVKVY